MLGLSYEPPMQWLRMLKGLRRIFQMAGKRWLQGNPGAVVNVLVKSASSPSDPDALFAEGSRVEFAHLHRPVTSRAQCQREGCEEGEGADDEKMEDPEARDAYNKTVSYIGTIHLAIKAGEHDMEVCRRLIAFAVLIPDKMIELIEEKRPRALVIFSTLLCRGSATGEGLVDRRRYTERSRSNSKMFARGMERPHALAAYDGKDDDYLQRRRFQ